MIKFKNTEAKLAEYVEMAVKFGSKVKNENFEDYASFEHAIRETRNGDAMIKSSSFIADVIYSLCLISSESHAVSPQTLRKSPLREIFSLWKAQA